MPLHGARLGMPAVLRLSGIYSLAVQFQMTRVGRPMCPMQGHSDSPAEPNSVA